MDRPFSYWNISETTEKLAKDTQASLTNIFSKIDEIREFNQLKVIRAFSEAKVSESAFAGTTGYGYDDRGRDQLEAVYANVFETEAALVRPQICAGTQALSIALFALLRTGDELLSVTGAPYDTLKRVIGINKNSTDVSEGALSEYGIKYRQIPLSSDDGGIDNELVEASIRPETKVVFIQRSRGYKDRRSLTSKEIGDTAKLVHKLRPDIYVMVDNCYGEFVEMHEPTAYGADFCVGSLIKNPGGGLAPTGAYMAGKKQCVDLCANRLYAPGLGNHVGPMLGLTRNFIQGLYLAPHIVGECLKGLTFASALFSAVGFKTSPEYDAVRSDIVQTVTFGEKDPLIAFCQAVQAASPVDSFVTPEPWPMPGYDCDVIMAAGAFVQGSSIELSADAPLRDPYIAYFQGGLVYENVKLAAMKACETILKNRRK